jgi:hypothetical protein
MTTTTRIPVTNAVFVLRGIGFTAMDCATCGVLFAVTDDYYERRAWDSANFHCPNGHTNTFAGKSRAELERKIADLTLQVQRRDYLIDQERVELACEKKSHAATKANLTRVRQRIGNGVCPECRRHFVNVERHMHNRHPDVAAQAG